MTASEKLTKLIEDDKLTNEQWYNLGNWSIIGVSELRDNLITLISKYKDEGDSVSYKKAVCGLFDLFKLDYSNGDYVVCDKYGVHELDFDTLNDVLDVD